MHGGERYWRERGLRDAVLGGDEQAWRAWYDASFATLYSYVLWRCGGLRDAADEIVQETWLAAVRRIQSFDPGQGPFDAWLRGIAVNLLRNRFRRNGRRRTELLVDDAVDPTAARRAAAERVAAALGALPTHYEAVLRAKYLDGGSVVDIAADRGETPKAVESLLSRARSAFRTAYLDLE